jgi:hypothetical protein
MGTIRDLESQNGMDWLFIRLNYLVSLIMLGKPVRQKIESVKFGTVIVDPSISVTFRQLYQ